MHYELVILTVSLVGSRRNKRIRSRVNFDCADDRRERGLRRRAEFDGQVTVGNLDEKRLDDAEEVGGGDGDEAGGVAGDVDVEGSGVGGLRLHQREIGHDVDGRGLFNLVE